MDISTSTNICSFQPGRNRNDYDFCIPVCAKAGYKVLDINFCSAMNPKSRLRDDDWEDYVKEIAQLGKQWNVEFRQSHLPYYDYFTAEPEKIRLMEELIRRSIIASGMLGVRWAVTHPYTDYAAGYDMDRCLERNVEYYSKHVATARAHGVGICLENDFEFRAGQPVQPIFCADPRDLVKLVDAFGDPEYVGACYDFGHGNLTGHDFHRQVLNLLGPRLHAIHVQDNHGSSDEHFLPFHGNIDWAEAMAGLADIDYDGELTFEVQEFGRYFPNEYKYAVVEYSLEVGRILVELFEKARREQGKA